MNTNLEVLSMGVTNFEQIDNKQCWHLLDDLLTL